MIKSEKHIERDLYSMVVKSDLAKMISGKVYRGGMRPDNSSKEDVVVKFLAGLDNQVQSGVLVVNVYVPDISNSAFPHPVENIARIEELEDKIIDFVTGCKSVEYLYEFDSTPTTIEVKDIGQHMIYARIKYQRITE